MKTIEMIRDSINHDNHLARSAWGRAVRDYAITILDNLEDNDETILTMPALLRGARDWAQYSYGGCALICEYDIARAVCTPSALRKCTRRDGTLKNPNSDETWMDVQARALSQAARLILKYGR